MSRDGYGALAARGGLVTMVCQAGKLAAQFVGLIVLSRVLDPAVFGVFAVVMSAVMLGELARDFGLSIAAVRAGELTHGQASNLFWLNVGVGATIAVSVFLGADALGGLLNEPALAEPLRAMCPIFVVMGAQAQFQVQIVRAMRFSALAVSDLACQLLGLAAAVSLALAGAEIWALVAQQMVLQSLLLVIRIRLARWTPSRPRRQQGTRSFIDFGVRLGAAQMLTYAATNIDNWSISYRAGAHALGIYSRAFQLFSLPVNQILFPLTNVILPMLSRLRENEDRLRTFVLQVQFYVGSLAVFAFSATVALAGEIAVVVLGDVWAPAGPVLALLAVGGAFQALSYVGYWLFLSEGLTSALFTYNLVTKSVTVVAVLVASAHGVVWVAAAYAACLALTWPINLAWLHRRAPVPTAQMTWHGLILLTAGLASGLTIEVITKTSGESIGLALVSMAGGLAALIAVLLLPSTTRVLVEDAVGVVGRRLRRR